MFSVTLDFEGRRNFDKDKGGVFQVGTPWVRAYRGSQERLSTLGGSTSVAGSQHAPFILKTTNEVGALIFILPIAG